MTGLALDPPSQPSFFDQVGVGDYVEDGRTDIRDLEALNARLSAAQPEVVFHLAAQSLVRCSYRDPVLTYETNAIGTLHVLEAVRQTASVGAVVVVTSDKCYQNQERADYAYVETDPLGGHDPYSASKACAELIPQSCRNVLCAEPARSIGVATVRAGNVIGGGDWAKDRLVPDLVRGVLANREVEIRNPDAVRPWQHVLEPLMGYLLLAECLCQEPMSFAESWNFGPLLADTRPVKWIADFFAREAGLRWNRGIEPTPHEAQFLSVDASKAQARLGWHPQLSLEEALELVLDWHQAQQAGKDMRAVSLSQIEHYQEAAV